MTTAINLINYISIVADYKKESKAWETIEKVSSNSIAITKRRQVEKSLFRK